MSADNFKGWELGYDSDRGVNYLYEANKTSDAARRIYDSEKIAAFREWRKSASTAKSSTPKRTNKTPEKINRFKTPKQKPLAKNSGRAWNISKEYSKYFHHSALNRVRGHSPEWTRNLIVKGGTNPNYNWERSSYRKFNGNTFSGTPKKLGAKSPKWGTSINKGGKGGAVLNGFKELVRQIEISAHALHINAEHFRVLVGERAIAVFQRSFRYHKFYTQNSTPWHPLAEYTIKKREKRHTGSTILVEYGDLRDSFELERNTGKPMTSIVKTNPVERNPSKHKQHTIAYAGYHNEGKGTYGSGWRGRKPRKYIKRKFMGHSTYLNPITDPFMRKMMKLYLFDSVFKVKK